MLVGASVLTTYQHHFFDIPTGALLGFFCLWLWPERESSPVAATQLSTDRRRLVLSTRYLIGGGLIATLALWVGAAGLWLLWPAISLVMVAMNYAVLGRAGFQKDARGHMNLAARVLLAPYLAGAFVNSRLWTRHEQKPVAVGDGVWLWRIPLAGEAAAFATVIDLCAELPGAATAGTWMCIPMLDLVPPEPAQLRYAAACIERARASGTVLVCCALGYSRSAAAVATWLLMSNRAENMSEAVEKVHRARPRVVIDVPLRTAIATATGRAI
jgi:hypothetical protein